MAGCDGMNGMDGMDGKWMGGMGWLPDGLDGLDGMDGWDGWDDGMWMGWVGWVGWEMDGLARGMEFVATMAFPHTPHTHTHTRNTIAHTHSTCTRDQKKPDARARTHTEQKLNNKAGRPFVPPNNEHAPFRRHTLRLILACQR